MPRIFLLLLLITSGCGNKQKSENQVLFSLKEMGDLATVEYTVTKIIKANDNKTWFKLGERKILMSCEAHIKAGIDMSVISPKNFIIIEKDIELKLPLPKVISVSMPAETIKVEYQDISFFRDPFKAAERDQLASQAETQIRNSIDSLGILEQAKVNASLFINDLLGRLGYENIKITYDDFQHNIKGQ